MKAEYMVFTGSSNPALAESVVQSLDTRLGNCMVTQYADGEPRVEYLESIRDTDVVLIQSTCRYLEGSVNDALVELCFMIASAKSSGAARVIAVIPSFGFARQDKKKGQRVPLGAAIAVRMLEAAGADKIISLDLHADQIQGYFRKGEFANWHARDVLKDDMRAHGINGSWRIISPDTGGAERARAYAKVLDNAEVAIIDKRRPRPNEAKVMNVIGDVDGWDCCTIDDLVDTAGTLCEGAAALRRNGARRIRAYCMHGVLSDPAVETIKASVLEEVVVTDTIPLSKKAEACPKIRVVPVGPYLGKIITAHMTGASVNALMGKGSEDV